MHLTWGVQFHIASLSLSSLYISLIEIIFWTSFVEKVEQLLLNVDNMYIEEFCLLRYNAM
jgi:hypothetical protein